VIFLRRTRDLFGKSLPAAWVESLPFQLNTTAPLIFAVGHLGQCAIGNGARDRRRRVLVICAKFSKPLSPDHHTIPCVAAITSCLSQWRYVAPSGSLERK
jgi:hypothetical protein